MPTTFKDFIPEGEDTGAQGKGFSDFVPPAKPVFHPETEVVEPTIEEPVVEEKPKKKKSK